jgi:hypothetical protein
MRNQVFEDSMNGFLFPISLNLAKPLKPNIDSMLQFAVLRNLAARIKMCFQSVWAQMQTIWLVVHFMAAVPMKSSYGFNGSS